MSYADDFEQIEYDPYEDCGQSGYWTDRSGGQVLIASMSKRHIKNAIRLCRNASESACSTDEEDKWDSWVEAFEGELDSRTKGAQPAPQSKPKKPARGKKIKLKCHCGTIYEARLADWNRGWARSCSKRCAAIKRDYGRPDAKETSK